MPSTGGRPAGLLRLPTHNAVIVDHRAADLMDSDDELEPQMPVITRVRLCLEELGGRFHDILVVVLDLNWIVIVKEDVREQDAATPRPWMELEAIIEDNSIAMQKVIAIATELKPKVMAVMQECEDWRGVESDGTYIEERMTEVWTLFDDILTNAAVILASIALVAICPEHSEISVAMRAIEIELGFCSVAKGCIESENRVYGALDHCKSW
ncbi:hypothetical protein BDR03DRAFT_1011865 [Suillus americanus]|nr:hypothetical protein BDR03DRAFT_1011865 [Suillus americanus]